MVDLSRAYERRGIGRRRGRGGGGGGSRARALEGAVRTFAFSNFRADTYTPDGPGTKVAAWTERSTNPSGILSITPNHALTQSTPAQQCALPAPSPLFGGRLVATFVDQRYSSTAPVSAWTFLHDGTGMTVYNVFSTDTVVGTKYILTTAFSATSRGFATGLSVATVLEYVGNGAAALAIINGGALTPNVATYSRCRYAESVNPECDIYIKTTVAATKILTDAAPSSLDAAGTLMLGNRVSIVDSPFVGKWAESITLKGPFDPNADLTIRQYFTAFYGLT